MYRQFWSKLKEYRPSRRDVVLGGLALGAGTFAAASPFVFENHNTKHFIRLILERNLPGVKIDDENLQLFVDELFSPAGFDGGLPDSKRFALAATAAYVVDGETAAGMADTYYGFEEMERIVVTQFLLGTDFLSHDDPTAIPLTYSGYSEVCGNPFAQPVTAG